jgi:septum formation protein
LILASGSVGRAALLRAAGLVFDVAAAPVDEAAAKRGAAAEGLDVAATALLLAELKAAAVSACHPDALVIGADQILECAGRRFDKPADLATAREHLRFLSGRTHRLVTACVCQVGGRTVWRHVAVPALTMRMLSDGWIDAYLAAAGEEVLGSVGAYRIEGFGLQCFAAVEGEHGAIIGLPMLPLLGFLRQCGVLEA